MLGLLLPPEVKVRDLRPHKLPPRVGCEGVRHEREDLAGLLAVVLLKRHYPTWEGGGGRGEGRGERGGRGRGRGEGRGGGGERGERGEGGGGGGERGEGGEGRGVTKHIPTRTVHTQTTHTYRYLHAKILSKASYMHIVA